MRAVDTAVAGLMLILLLTGCGPEKSQTEGDQSAQCQVTLDQSLASCEASRSRLDQKHYQGCKEQAQEAHTRCLEQIQQDGTGG